MINEAPEKIRIVDFDFICTSSVNVLALINPDKQQWIIVMMMSMKLMITIIKMMILAEMKQRKNSCLTLLLPACVMSSGRVLFCLSNILSKISDKMMYSFE